MNLRQLYYFRTIAELEHYTKAAEKLFISQSNLSHAIQDMEEELNVKLFVRKGRNIKLTKYGELFLPYVQKTIETLESGIATLQEYINPNSGAVSMVAFPSMAAFVPDIIVRYLSDTKRVGVRFQFVQKSYFDAREMLLTGKADLVLATKFDDPDVESVCIGTHPLVLMVPLGHRLASKSSVSLRELDGEDFIAFDKGGQLHYQCLEWFKERNINPNVVVETHQDVVMHGLVAANHGVAITPYPLGGAPYNVKILSISDDLPPRQVYLTWHKERYIPPAAEYFRDYIVQSGKMFDQFCSRSGTVLL